MRPIDRFRMGMMRLAVEVEAPTVQQLVSQRALGYAAILNLALGVRVCGGAGVMEENRAARKWRGEVDGNNLCRSRCARWVIHAGTIRSILAVVIVPSLSSSVREQIRCG